MIKLEVLPEQQDSKVTECVAHMLPELKKYNLRRMIRKGDIKLNGSRIKRDFAVAAGDVIEVYMPIELAPAPVLDVCYEDRNMLLINKQPGSAVEGEGDFPDVHSMVVQYLKDNGEYLESTGNVPFPCYPMDVYTGGLVLFAKNGEMFEILRRAIQERRIQRTFKAIVKGSPKQREGEWQHFYTRGRGDAYKVIDKNSQDAVPIYTRYQALRSNGTYSLLHIEPVTQCYDQERAHLQAVGLPILGDAVYGNARLNRKMGIRYQALWGDEVRFATGTNNALAYMNGRVVHTSNINFPLVKI